MVWDICILISKKDGYKKSTEISKEYNMYRQYYCGCVFSKKQRDEEIRKKKRSRDRGIN